MADDSLDSILGEGLDDDIPVVVGGQRRLMQGGRIIDVPTAPAPSTSPSPSLASQGKDRMGVAALPASATSTSSSAPVQGKPSAPSLPRAASRGAPFAPSAPSPAPAPQKPSDMDLAGQLAEDAAVIHEVEEKDLSKKIDALETQTVESLITGLADEAMSVIGIRFDTEDMRRRFHTVVDAYFKDLRDALETKSKLTMPVPSGGMGMTEEQAAKVMGTLTAKQVEFESALQSRLRTEKDGYVAKRAEKQMTERDEFERGESASLDRLYAKVTGTEPPVPSEVAAPPLFHQSEVLSLSKGGRGPASGGKEPQQSKPAVAKPEPPPKVIQVVQEPKKARELESATAREPVASAVPAKTDALDGFFKEAEKSVPPSSQPSPASAPSAPSAPFAPFAPSAPLSRSAPKPITPVPPPIPATGKPVVSDVKAAPTRLVGPVEELRSIAIRDFRRLSRDPGEATLKIKDKIDLLENQSFAQKTAGITAWRESPTNRLYLDILRQSLEGIPVADVIGTMESQGKEVLTKAEFDAIMALNRTLRFG